RIASPDIILAGILLEDGALSLAVLPRVLERAGMVSEFRRARLADLALFDLPAVVTGPDGDYLLLLDQAGEGRFSGLRQSDGAAIEIDATDPEWTGRKRLMLVRPQAGGEDAGGVSPAEPAADGNWLRAALRGHSREILLVFLAAVFINLFAIA